MITTYHTITDGNGEDTDVEVTTRVDLGFPPTPWHPGDLPEVRIVNVKVHDRIALGVVRELIVDELIDEIEEDAIAAAEEWRRRAREAGAWI